MNVEIESPILTSIPQSIEESQTVEPTQQTDKVIDNDSKKNNATNSPLECGICYEESDEPVTTTCGHIYCWSCIYKWIQTKSGATSCPVCNNTVSEDKLIPLYPKNYSQEKKNAASTDGVPKRPHAKREATAGYRGPGSSFFTGINIHMSNFRMTIGCLPTLLPMLIMIILNIFAYFFDDEEASYADDSDSDHYDRIRTRSEENQGAYDDPYETDAFDWTVILLMIAFISLPFILNRFRRH